MKRFLCLLLPLALLFAALTLVGCGKEETGKGKENQVNTAVTYQVTFVTGTGENRVVEAAENSTVGEPTPPVRENYVFTGWKENGKTWYFPADKITKNTTLTASWVSASSVFTYEVAGGEVVITSLKSNYPTDKIRVPDVIDGYPVTTVGEEAFSDISDEDSKLSLSFGKNLTKVRRAAFAGSESVSVSFEAALTGIGERAFYGCTGLTTLAVASLPDGVLPFDAFNGCTGLTSLALPEGTVGISENVFYGCSSLTWITLPKSLTSVEDSAFSGCRSLKSVYFRGSEADFAGIAIAEGNGGNDVLTGAKWYFYSAEKPAESGKYWYEKDGKIRFW